MTIEIIDNGSNNDISVDRDYIENGNGTISINGDNNTIRMCGPLRRIDHLDLTLGSNCTIFFEDHCILGSLYVYASDFCRLRIASWASINSSLRILMHEPSSVLIGRDCLFGGGIEIATSDMHSILSVAGGNRINPSRNIVIEDHVWIGSYCSILKGASIGSNSVIGTRSVVTGRIPPQVIAAGAPARVLKKGVTWTHPLLPVVAPTGMDNSLFRKIFRRH